MGEGDTFGTGVHRSEVEGGGLKCLEMLQRNVSTTDAPVPGGV